MSDSTEENTNKLKITRSSAIFIGVFTVLLLSPIFIYLLFISSHNESDDCLSKNSLNALISTIHSEYPELSNNSTQTTKNGIGNRKNITHSKNKYFCEALISHGGRSSYINYNYDFKKRIVENISPIFPSCEEKNMTTHLMAILEPQLLKTYPNIFPRPLKINPTQQTSYSNDCRECYTEFSFTLKDSDGSEKLVNIPTYYNIKLSDRLFYNIKCAFDFGEIDANYPRNTDTKKETINAEKSSPKKHDNVEKSRKTMSSSQNYREREIEKTKNELLMPSKDSVQQAESDLF